MRDKLLIACKNGRSVRTYGVNRVDINNMKFAFICAVIVISCVLCVTGDLEIYPGLKFNLNTEGRRQRLENYEDPNYYTHYKRYPWQNIPLDEYEDLEQKDVPEYDFTLPDRIRQFEEVIEWERALNRHNKPRHRYELDEIYKKTKNLNKNLNKLNFDKYGVGIPTNPILDDVRMYPQEDDFSFKNDEDDDVNIQKLYPETPLDDQSDMFLENPQLSLDKVRSSNIGMNLNERPLHHNHHADEKISNDEQFSSGTFKDVKVVEDPTKFAYAPPDPRFYEKPEITEELDTNLEDPIRSPQDDQLKIKSRSDQKLREDHQGIFANEATNYKSSSESHRSDGLDVVAVKPNVPEADSAGVYIKAVIAGISAAATVALIAVGIGWYNLQKHVKNASDVEYPAYGVTGPNKDISPSGDRRLAQSAQMYHYQHQKQQIIAMERAPPGERHGSVSDVESDEENEEGDYTVYECPGLAPTGEMEVKNPLFLDDPTPAQTPPVKSNADENK